VFERNVQAAVKRWRYQPIAATQTVTRTFDFAR
jgi:outer membrane biosynthesis protein TonB